MTIVLRAVTRGTADAILAGERPGDVRVADDYPTEFSVGVAQRVGAERQFGPFLLHRAEDDLVVGEIGGAFVDEEGTIEIGYAVVESQWNRGYATAAVEALVTKARAASEVRRIVAHTPLERPASGRVLEKAGFGMVREMEDEDADGTVGRVKEWQLATETCTRGVGLLVCTGVVADRRVTEGTPRTTPSTSPRPGGGHPICAPAAWDCRARSSPPPRAT
jgi:GNAT superfamily N-acetyltransferase